MRSTHQENQHPPIQRHLVQNREAVGPRNDVHKQRGSERSLIREQLHAVHAKLGMVDSHPDRINRTAKNAAERKDHAEQGRLLALVARMGQRVKVRRHPHADADRKQGKHGGPRQCFLVQGEIKRGDGRREQDAADLVERDGGVGEGEVLQYHVQTHGCGQW